MNPILYRLTLFGHKYGDLLLLLYFISICCYDLLYSVLLSIIQSYIRQQLIFTSNRVTIFIINRFVNTPTLVPTHLDTNTLIEQHGLIVARQLVVLVLHIFNFNT